MHRSTGKGADGARSERAETEALIVASVVPGWITRSDRSGEYRACRHLPEALVEQMKQLGVYGLLVPAELGGVDVSMSCFAAVTEELARGRDEPGGCDGRHSVVAAAPLRNR